MTSLCLVTYMMFGVCLQMVGLCERTPIFDIFGKTETKTQHISTTFK